MTEYTPPTHGKSIAEQLWDRMDQLMDQVKGTQATDIFDPLTEVKAAANELASVLVLMCQPYYATQPDVLKQAYKRWKMRQGTLPYEPTPGYKYNPPPAGTKYETPRVRPANTGKPVPAAVNFKPQQITDIKAAHMMGLSVGDLAEIYKTSEQHITSLVNP